MSNATDRRNDAALFGTAAVAWMLAASKWGSYIQLGPFFAGDILIGIAFAYALASYLIKPKRTPNLPAELERGPHWAIALLVMWAIARLLFSEGGLDMRMLRDFAPYLYATLGIFSCVAAYYSTERARVKTCQILWWALMFHLAWISLVQLAPPVAAVMPVTPGGQQVLQVREDIDSAILGVTAAIALYRWLDQRGRRYLLIAGIALVLVLLIPSRSGLIGSFFAVALALTVFSGKNQDRRRSIVMATFLPLVAMVAVLTLVQAPAVNRLLASFDPSRATAEGYASATGTTDARERTWKIVVDHATDTPSKAVVGVGFGPDFMLDSGAAYPLLGTDAARAGVRSPHNYWIGTLARLGIVGAALAAVVALATCLNIIRVRRFLGTSELHLIAALIVAAFLPTATFGVTFESPFGAIPYYWAAGLVLGIRVAIPLRAQGVPSSVRPQNQIGFRTATGKAA